MDVFITSLEDFKHYMKKYENFVVLNPRLSSEIEAIVRWSSYLTSSSKSPILGELLCSGANLLQLCNDIILRQSNPDLKINFKNYIIQLKTFLAAIQSLELFAEIYAREKYGTVGKWSVIAAIQITKAAIRMVLLIVYTNGISKSQAIVPLDRALFSDMVKLQRMVGCSSDNLNEPTPSCSNYHESNNSGYVVLKSSGRKIKSINDARSGKFGCLNETTSPAQDSKALKDLQKRKLLFLLSRCRDDTANPLTKRQTCAEILHIMRPVVHLGLMGVLSSTSWMPYIVALGMDLTSINLIRPLPNSEIIQDNPQLVTQPVNQYNFQERVELGQRAASLLLYMLRSPFFEQYTKDKALKGITSTAESIPLFGSFLATFLNYIPEWQKDYFRVWG